MNIKQASTSLKDAHPIEIIQWGVEHIGIKELTFACSFGFEDVALVDFVQKADPNIPIFYLDTSLLFTETYQVKDELAKQYNIEFIRVSTSLTVEEQATEYGDALWERDPNQCCGLRKVKPLKEFLSNYKGWITGIRREQSLTRAHTEVVEWDEGFQLIKLNPLAYWTADQVWNYIREHKIPYNPLHDQNYPSIGCYPCTRQVLLGEDPRAGRWAGTTKTECGLHNSPVSKK